MKTMKIATIATIITIIVIALCGVATANAEEFYRLPVVVTAWEKIGDTALCVIDCTAQDGQVWSFYDDEGIYKIGDKLILTMWEATEDEEDDEVVDVEYVETLKPSVVARWMKW